MFSILETRQSVAYPLAQKLDPVTLPWKSIGFQILLRSKYVPSLIKIHWRMLILECSQGCYAVKIWPSDIDIWPMTLTINRVKLRRDIVTLQSVLHSFHNILVNTLGSTSFNGFWPNLVHKRIWNPSDSLKINRVPDSPKD
jgi:hypothetical protein